jgi:hypothetical protein
MAVLAYSVFLHRTGMDKLLQVFPIAALLGAALAGVSWNGVGWRRFLALPVAIWGTLVLVMGAVGWLGTWKAHDAGVRLGEPRADVVLRQPYAMAIRSLLGEIRATTQPGEPIFVAPYRPMLYVLSGCRNPTRHDAVFPGAFEQPSVSQEIIEDLEASSVKTIVVLDIPWDGREDRRFPRYAPQFARYLEQEFEIHKRLGQYLFLTRRKANGTSRPPDPLS